MYLIQEYERDNFGEGSRPLLSRSGCILREKNNPNNIIAKFSSPFIEERLYLIAEYKTALNFYKQFSSPFIEERLYLLGSDVLLENLVMFSSPFIEERLYLKQWKSIFLRVSVLVPFYRGAVVFDGEEKDVYWDNEKFSSPFIEERLYLGKL